MRRGPYRQGARRTAPRPARRTAAAGSSRRRRLRGRAHEPRADDHAVGAGRRRRGRRRPGVPMPKPSATGTSVRALRAGEDRRPGGASAGALAGRARARRPCRRSRARGAPIAASRVVAASSAPRAARARRPRASQAASTSPRLLERQVGHDQAADAALGELVGEALDAAREHEVRVAHEHHRDGLGERRGRPRARRATRRAGRERRGAGGVDHRAVGERVRERHAELDQVGAALRVGLADRARARRASGKPPIR